MPDEAHDKDIMVQVAADNATANKLQGLLGDCFNVAIIGVRYPDREDPTHFSDMDRDQVKQFAEYCAVWMAI